MRSAAKEEEEEVQDDSAAGKVEEDDMFDESRDSDLLEAERRLRVLSDRLYKEGYRAGVERDGESPDLQSAFDSAYAASCRLARGAAALRATLDTVLQAFEEEEEEKKEKLSRLRRIAGDAGRREEALLRHLKGGDAGEDWQIRARELADVSDLKESAGQVLSEIECPVKL